MTLATVYPMSFGPFVERTISYNIFATRIMYKSYRR